MDIMPCHKAHNISNWFREHDISNIASLGCGGTWNSHYTCEADKSAATVWCYHVDMGQNLWGMVWGPCCHKDSRQV